MTVLGLVAGLTEFVPFIGPTASVVVVVLVKVFCADDVLNGAVELLGKP